MAQTLNMLPQVQNITLPDGQEAIFIPANDKKIKSSRLSDF